MFIITKMYIMCNGNKYNENDFIDFGDDEVYMVFENNRLPQSIEWARINKVYISNVIAYYCSIIEKTTKYIDNEILVPIRKFIHADHRYIYQGGTGFSPYNHVDVNKIPNNIAKVITYTLFDDTHKYIDNDKVRQYIFSDYTLFIAVTTDFNDNELMGKFCFTTTTYMTQMQYAIQKN